MITAFYKTTSIILRTPHQWNLLPTLCVMALQIIILSILKRCKQMDPNIITLGIAQKEATGTIQVTENPALRGGTKATWIPAANELQVPPLYYKDVVKAVAGVGTYPAGLQIIRFNTEASTFDQHA